MRKTVIFACGDDQAFEILKNVVLVGGAFFGTVLTLLVQWTGKGTLVGPMLLIVPALLLACCFPVSERFEQKLDRAIQLRSTGECPRALEKQLEKTLVKKRFRPVLKHFLIVVVRVFYHHRLQGTENLHATAEDPVVILLNHGEMYGPVVGMAFTPLELRPWMISELVDDPQEMAAYVHRFTISRQRWIPERLKWPLARLLGRISVWGSDQLEAIAVYRNTPSRLMSTMRDSVEALQAGDSLLIFPENPNAVYDGHGYERDGVGELFDGFAVLGRIYGSRTGKSCRFVPAFAHQGRRTLTFGHEILFDTTNPDAMAQASRVAEAAKAEMLRIWREEESKMKKPRRARLSAGEKVKKQNEKDREN